jgi:peptidoglycan/LPS O-acetylase OafA/YrhL
MGALRLYLALCVVAVHAGGTAWWPLHDGRHAVEIFYIISGFYMALVLSTRYADIRDFYASRALRIFPVYWLVLLGVVAFAAATGLASGRWQRLTLLLDSPLSRNGAAGVWLSSLSNVTLFGQDWMYFLSDRAGEGLRFTAFPYSDPQPLWAYALNPPSWTVAVELTFYLLAPFLNRLTTPWLAAIALASAGARVAAIGAFDLTFDPWTYRFFPFELMNFVLGMLAYRAYAHFRGRPVALKWNVGGGALAIVALAALQLGAERWLQARWGEYATLLSYVFWAAAIAVVFRFSQRNERDRLLGELSYPVYLVHWTICVSLRAVLEPRGAPPVIVFLAAAGLSVLLSIGLYRWAVAPIDAYRRRLAVA